MMPQTRCEVIHHTILCCGEVDETRSKSKIEPFLNKLVTRFQEVYYPFQELLIDEMLIKWKGLWEYKQYIPSKPSKYIETFVLCDSITSYCYIVLTYFGNESSYANFETGTGQFEKIFEYLPRPLGKGYHIYAYQYYTNHSLISYLISNNKIHW